MKEELGKGFGESLYSAVESQLDEPVDKTVLVNDRDNMTVVADPVYTSLAILGMFEGQLDETYLNEADPGRGDFKLIKFSTCSFSR